MLKSPRSTQPKSVRTRFAYGLTLALLFYAPFLYAQNGGADAVSLYRQGRTAYVQDNLYRAVELYKEALGQNPSYLEPMLGLAETYYALGEYDQAVTYVMKARTLAREEPQVITLEARIRIGLGDLETARSLFQKVLATQPNNVDALLGLAELQAAQGNNAAAAERYLESIRLAPENRKALLSLALIYDYRGDSAAAQRYLDLALRYHRDSPLVQLMAARHFVRQHRPDVARSHAHTALNLKPGYVDAQLLLAEIALRQGDYSQAVSLVGPVIDADRNRIVAWYVRAVALARSGNTDQSLQSFQMALRLDASDEVVRATAEQVVLDKLAVEDSRRQDFAAYHFARGDEYRNQNYFDRALAEYRRGLLLNPYSRSGRLAYAEIYRLRGHTAKYLDELKVLQSVGHSDTYVSDRVEVYQSVVQNGVADSWGVDQFSVNRDRTTFQIFFIADQQQLEHPLAASYLAQYLQDRMLAVQHFAFPKPPQEVENFAEAFRDARQAGSDYFMLISFDGEDRSFQATDLLYVSRSGSEVGRYQSGRNGNDRVREVAGTIASALGRDVPPRGVLLDRKQNSGLVSLGSLDGLTADSKLVMLRKGSVVLRSDKPGFLYGEGDVVGEFDVTRLDDLVAEGTITKSSFFDLVNVGDEVVEPPAETTGVVSPADMFPPLYRRIREIR